MSARRLPSFRTLIHWARQAIGATLLRRPAPQKVPGPKAAAHHTAMQFARVLLLVLSGVLGLVRQAEAQSLYIGDGLPTALEEEIRWKLNRGRFDTVSENLTRGTAYTNVPASSGPLAPNQDLTVASRHQSEDMAKVNMFQHNTVPGSLYYNPTTQPLPWDRMVAEGYSWNNAAENIAAGYTGAESVYVGWWNSSGHRVNMYNGALREIGNGYYNWSASTYKSYYTMDLGSSGSACFFTDTIFQDANANGTYDQGEGVPGVAVRMVVGGNAAGTYDVSTAVGSFAVPIQSIAGGATVQVMLSNTTTASLVLTIPKDYANSSTMSLVAGESRVCGAFIRPATTRNIGFRDLTPVPAQPTPPRLTLVATGTNVLLLWNSDSSLKYQPQWSADFVVWNSLTNSFLSGTGSNLTCLDTATTAPVCRFYRILVRAP